MVGDGEHDGVDDGEYDGEYDSEHDGSWWSMIINDGELGCLMLLNELTMTASNDGWWWLVRLTNNQPWLTMMKLMSQYQG